MLDEWPNCLLLFIQRVLPPLRCFVAGRPPSGAFPASGFASRLAACLAGCFALCFCARPVAFVGFAWLALGTSPPSGRQRAANIVGFLELAAVNAVNVGFISVSIDQLALCHATSRQGPGRPERLK